MMDGRRVDAETRSHCGAKLTERSDAHPSVSDRSRDAGNVCSRDENVVVSRFFDHRASERAWRRRVSVPVSFICSHWNLPLPQARFRVFALVRCGQLVCFSCPASFCLRLAFCAARALCGFTACPSSLCQIPPLRWLLFVPVLCVYRVGSYTAAAKRVCTSVIGVCLFSSA